MSLRELNDILLSLQRYIRRQTHYSLGFIDSVITITNSYMMPPRRKRLAIDPLAPLGKKAPGNRSLPVPYSIRKISCIVRLYERDLASVARTLVSVRFSAPSDRGTTTPSSLSPHLPSWFASVEVRLVNSASHIIWLHSLVRPLVQQRSHNSTLS